MQKNIEVQELVKKEQQLKLGIYLKVVEKWHTT